MENIGLGIGLTVVGVGTVFLVLVLLQVTMGIETSVLNGLFRHQEQNPRTIIKSADTKQSAPVPSDTGQEGETAQSQSKAEALPPQLLAAIVAAIACQTGQPAQSFRVVSVRQAWDRSGSGGWSMQGRTDLINTRSSFYAKGGSK